MLRASMLVFTLHRSTAENMMYSLVFKYALSGRVRRKCEAKVSWAAVARVSQEAGFKGVMIIRYSIVPPRESSLVTSASWTLLISLASGHTDLANPIFATTGMTFL